MAEPTDETYGRFGLTDAERSALTPEDLAMFEYAEQCCDGDGDGDPFNGLPYCDMFDELGHSVYGHCCRARQ